ncbi:MAG: YqzL family protein [bacterium]|nr:YqzL family protein [bacterium]
MIDLVWEIFKKTGDIKYFLLAKRLEGETNETNKNRRDSSNRNKL